MYCQCWENHVCFGKTFCLFPSACWLWSVVPSAVVVNYHSQKQTSCWLTWKCNMETVRQDKYGINGCRSCVYIGKKKTLQEQQQNHDPKCLHWIVIVCLKQQVLGQVTPKPTEVMRASALRFPDLNRSLDFLPRENKWWQFNQTESQTSCGSYNSSCGQFSISPWKSIDWIPPGYTALIWHICCWYLLNCHVCATADLWKVVLKGESKDYIHASFANVRVLKCRVTMW